MLRTVCVGPALMQDTVVGLAGRNGLTRDVETRTMGARIQVVYRAGLWQVSCLSHRKKAP